MRSTFLLALFCIAAALSGCSSAPTQKKVDERDALQEYVEAKADLEKSDVISPGFRLRIRHASDAQISGEYRVDYRGMLHLPYKVKIQAAGRSTSHLGDALEAAYQPYFKANNKVTVEIAHREYLVEVRGLVSKPGTYTVKLDTSIEELIAMCGGLTMPTGGTGGDNKNAQVQRPEYVRIVTPDFMNKDKKASVRWVRLTDYFLKYDPRNEVLWRGGEQLFFQLSADASAVSAGGQTVQIMGEVHRPGEYPLQPGMDLGWYVGQAGGPTSTADLNNVVIIHRKADESETLNFVDATGRPLKASAGDVILVRSTTFKPSFMERIGPFFVAIGSLFVSIAVAVLAL